MSGRHGQILAVGVAECPKNCRPCSPALFLRQFFRGVVPITPLLILGSVDANPYLFPLLPWS